MKEEKNTEVPKKCEVCGLEQWYNRHKPGCIYAPFMLIPKKVWKGSK